MTAADEAETHERKFRKHLYRAASAERQALQLQKYAADEWGKAFAHRDLATAARETEHEEMARAAVAASAEEN